MHPAAWWAWALGIVVLAGRTGSATVLTLLALTALAVLLLARRRGGPAPGAYLTLALAVVVVRLVFHVLVGVPGGGTVIVDLPTLEVSWAPGLSLLGPITTGGLLSAVIGGLRLAVMVLAIGAAATAAPPTRLLPLLPPALHHLATAVVIAVAVAPSLSAAAGATRRARRLRGLPTRGVRAVAGTALPVLADALDRSLALAASMDTRGYARLLAPRDRRVTPLLLGSLVALGLGTYGLLTGDLRYGLPGLAVAVLLGAVAAGLAGRGPRRTQYRPARWRPPDLLLACVGALLALGATAGVPGGALAAAAVLGAVVGSVREPGARYREALA
ncbi:energy-coupling factor transporter transmembrane protein EcfT [Actinotalea sp. M2MS4P-6]|uniref:CbiQ family ECF transporter T component n=1 Tax=Actinotalea sp. M2MS4P-6 TaxID=2983762 RepID=UPI0021E3F1D7|nr:CbiQ family ECF transporter T component [Actinotalea sp. M2MS4P-6]MCV2394640.1 energy-coupling factor transporter transmembrane protein EcfT [Actinotalea sp. M2MS4P-6]